MRINIVGDITKKKILLIHPSAADNRCFEPMLPYLKDFCIVMPILNGHNIHDSSVYRNRKEEAKEIVQELLKMKIDDIYTLCAESLGCIIGWEIFLTKKLNIRKVLFDGGCFGRYGAFMRFCNYQGTYSLVKKCKNSNGPVKQLQKQYPLIAKSMQEVLTHYDAETLKNIIDDSMIGTEIVKDAVSKNDNIIVMYGKKDPYIRGLKWFDKAGYPIKKIVLENYGHCEYVFREMENYCKLITS